MSVARTQLKRLANKSTKLIGAMRGESFPFYYVTEYPKSGGSWLAAMIADCLRVPFPKNPIFPLGFSCVIHNHWKFNPRLRRVVYLSRDGRDVMTSFYFHRMRRLEQGKHGLRERYDRAFGKGFDPKDVERYLPTFIDLEFRKPRDARVTWTEHVNQWLDRPHVTYVTYEALLDDANAAMAHVLEGIADAPVPDWLRTMTVDKHSMARMTGRKPGEEDRGSFIRKGVAGDWVNHFSREAAECFDAVAGDTLIRLGYEVDRSWVDRVGRARRSSTPAPGAGTAQHPRILATGT